MGKNIKTRSKSSLFLMELIVVLMFFSLCAAICMKVFAVSKVKTDYANDLSHASFAVETAAEVYKDKKGDVNSVAEFFGGAKTEDSTVTVYYDREWNIVPSAQESEYEMTLVSDSTGLLNEAVITVTETGKDESIFDIATAVVGDIKEGV